MKRNGYTVIELVVVLAVFSVGYFAAAWIISGKVNVNFEELLYEEKISAIEKQASIYAMSEESLFEKEKVAYLTVGDLAEKNAIISNENGKVDDPRNDEKNLNDIKIKLTKDDDKVTAVVLN